jgi:TctA family transporter
MLEAMQSALLGLMQWQHLAYMMLGVFVGLVIGFLPGLGGISGMSLLIPFVYGMDQVSAVAMLIGMVAVIPTGDTFTSVLMGIPGSSASQATVLDGYPLARQGQAARALSAAFWSSMIGGVFGALLLTFFVVVAKPLILLFSSAELFMLAILGLSMVGVLSGNSILRGVSACGLGAMFGAIGAAPATGETRFDLSLAYLSDGVPLTIIGLGLFAIPELTELMRRKQAIARHSDLGSGWIQGMKDTIRHWKLILQSSWIGTVVGALPGLGGGVVDWITYGLTVQTAKDRSQFGKGDIRGVIAPESANNSLQGGALMPTLIFGIPGSGSMAVFMGGMVLLGIQPGPNMVTSDLNVTYTIAWTLAIASIIGAFACFICAYPMARLTFIPFDRIAPFMLMITCFGAFQARRNLMDLVLLFLIGILGILMRRFGWSRPAFLIGFVLAEPIENYLYQALQFNGWGFLLRPGVIIIFLLTLVSVWVGSRVRISEDGVSFGSGTKVGKDAQDAQPATTTPGNPNSVADRLPQILFAAFVVLTFAYGVWSSVSLTFLGSVFPLSTSVVMLVLSGLVLWKLAAAGSVSSSLWSDQEISDRRAGTHDGSSVWGPLGWFAFLFVLTALAGFIIALTVFILAYLLISARLSLLKTLVYCAICVGFMIQLAYMLTLDFPSGLLQRLVELPWPLR